MDKIVFVGGVNRGTELADSDNWNRLLNLYTTLVAAGAQLLPERLAAIVTAEAIKGLGALAKAWISYAVEANGVPGVAAMMPESDFVKRLNETQVGQPRPGTTLWYVLGSDFEPNLGGAGLKEGVLTWLADSGVDRLMGRSNDLVVNTDSMGAIDVAVGTVSGFVEDDHFYDPADGVYHTAYFNQDPTAKLLAKWLSLPLQGASASGGRRAGGSSPRPDVSEVVPPRRRPALGRRRDPADRSAEALDSRTTSGSYPGGSVVLSRGRDVDEHAAANGANTRRKPSRTDPRKAPSRAPKSGPKRGRGHDKTIPDAPAAKTEKAHAEPPDVTVQVRAAMVATIALGQTETLRCTVSRERLLDLAGATDSSSANVKRDKKLTIQAIAKADVEIAGTDRADIDVPAANQPTDLFFDVKATGVGHAEVHIIARQGPVPLATLVVRPTVLRTSTAVRAKPQLVHAAAQKVASRAPETCVKQWLRITEQTTTGVGTRYRFELEAEDINELTVGLSEFLSDDKEAYVAALYKEIEERWISSSQDVAAFSEDLKAIGGQMFDQLIPREIGEILWKNRKKLRNLLVLADEPYIPWELVHLKDHANLPKENWTLARLGLLRWLPADYPPVTLKHGKVRTVVPNYPPEAELAELPGAKKEAAYLEEHLGGKPIKADRSALMKVLREPGLVDVLHFSGHGVNTGPDAAILLNGRVERDPQNELDVYIEDRLGDVTIGQSAHLRSRDGSTGAMVVLNSCQTGRLNPGLTHMGGFADAFLRAGAGVFISSLWSIGDNAAQAFTEALYSALIKGKTLAEAAVNAREACRKDADGDATWLAYVVYGNPCAKFASDSR